MSPPRAVACLVPAGTCGYCFRAQVKYNASTSTFVLWSDAGLGNSYAVYTSSTPTGPFTRRPDPVLAVGSAVDMSLFVDDDGTGYLIHNTTQVAVGLTADMVVEQLTPDYLGTTGANVRLGLGDVRGRLHPARAEAHAGSPSDSSRPNIRLRFWTACEEVPW